ncbi:MAG: hypothetical protein HZB55_09500 [Deltaproteobacteria bacterium]|nr:hypothetical protein [Deltaproteobacteria bacterium]
MDPAGPDLDRLEEKIQRLKREYDLFLAGQRRGEPVSLHDELDREIRRLSRYPLTSTVARFRMSSLAHRFRALETQIRSLLDQREARKRDGEPRPAPGPASVVVDRAALENPRAIEAHLRALHRALAESLNGRTPPPVEGLKARLLEEARRLVERPGVAAVRFTLVCEEKGPRIRGELLPEGGRGL